MSAETIGIMEGAYFVSRGELLKWLNDFLVLDPPYTKLEQVCSGSAFCQITDALYPGKVPLHRVNFSAKHEVEFIKNFKVLQETFDRLGVVKAIDIGKLVKGKYQDNLEFCQWMKRFFDIHYSNVEYQAVERRNAAIAAYGAATRSAAAANRRQTVTSVPTSAAKSKRETITVLPTSKAPTAAKSLAESKENKAPIITATKSAAAAATSSYRAPTAAATSESNAIKQQLEESQKKVQSLKLMIDTLEKERNFYYSRLREVELLCQTYEDQSLPFLQQVLSILYKSEDSSISNTTSTAESPVLEQQLQPLTVQ